MTTCEYCGGEHLGLYAAGRFCNKACACGFATRDKRSDINRRVSERLRGMAPPARGAGRPYLPGYDPRRGEWTEARRAKAAESRHSFMAAMPWNELGTASRRKRVITEQGGKCLCGISEWNGASLTLEMHHKNGDDADNSRENLEALCPNCHSQTPNFRRYRAGDVFVCGPRKH